MSIKNALTFDVEEWFQVTSLEPYVKRGDWYSLKSLVMPQTRKVLDICDEFGVKATFFVLGYVARKYPELVREIDVRGHELASHGDEHRLVCRLAPEVFEGDVLRSKDALEQISGKAVIGYRAPSWSITDDTKWALEILEKHGFKYDSSIIPGKIRYGISDASRFPFKISDDKEILEFPLSTVNLSGKLFPFSGGLFLRALPYGLVSRWTRQFNLEKQPVMVYLHPWELDPFHPVLKVGLKPYIIHYYNLNKTEKRLRSLLQNFKFDMMKNVLKLEDEG